MSLEKKVKNNGRIRKKNYERLLYEAKFYKSLYEQEKNKRISEERLVEKLKTALHVVKPLKAYPRTIPETSHREQELVLLFSDCQIGEKIQRKETGYLEYNIDVFERRLEKLYTSVLNITERHRKDCGIDNLNVFMLGDIVEGRQIYKGQSSRVTTDVVEQMFRGQELIAGFLRSLSRYYDNIKVSCVCGNHGRVGKKNEELTHVNWDYVIYRNLQEILRNIGNIRIDVDKKWWKIVNVQGWKFYLEHGDRIKKFWQIPWYGIERADNRVLKMMRALNQDYDYFVIGHHHVPFECDANRGERICNGTFSSGNPYAMRDLKVMARPTQKLFGVHREVGITFRYNVRLDLG